MTKLLLISALSLGILSGCGKSSTTSTATTGTGGSSLGLTGDSSTTGTSGTTGGIGSSSLTSTGASTCGSLQQAWVQMGSICQSSTQALLSNLSTRCISAIQYVHPGAECGNLQSAVSAAAAACGTNFSFQGVSSSCSQAMSQIIQ